MTDISASTSLLKESIGISSPKNERACLLRYERAQTRREKLQFARAAMLAEKLRSFYGELPACANPPITPVRIIVDKWRSRYFYDLAGGLFRNAQSDILMLSIQNSYVRFHVALHEFLHATSFRTLRNKKMKGHRVPIDRVGLYFRVWKQRHRCAIHRGWVLNEAVTEELTRRALLKLPCDDPILRAVSRRVLQERAMAKLLFTPADMQHHKIYSDDELAGWTLARWGLGYLGIKRPYKFGYSKERQAMFAYLEKLACGLTALEGGGGTKDVREKLFLMLARAYFDGNLLPFARICVKVFGRQAFSALWKVGSAGEFDRYTKKLALRDQS